MKKLLLYLLRWQLSTPILAVVVSMTINNMNSFYSTMIANLIGGLLFYNVDKFIFKKH